MAHLSTQLGLESNSKLQPLTLTTLSGDPKPHPPKTRVFSDFQFRLGGRIPSSPCVRTPPSPPLRSVQTGKEPACSPRACAPPPNLSPFPSAAGRRRVPETPHEAGAGREKEEEVRAATLADAACIPPTGNAVVKKTKKTTTWRCWKSVTGWGAETLSRCSTSRWDIQRIREQRMFQRLQQRMNRKKVVTEAEPELSSFYPDTEDGRSAPPRFFL